MKQFVIPVHSFVDLITNSSSELFVCNTDKSVKMVKEIIVGLTERYNATQVLYPKGQRDTLDIDKLFDSYFQEPYVSDGSDTDVHSDRVANKGDIIIRSADDNSIPYEMWDDIEAIFSAQRYHLG